jgi:phospholipid-translocating ATPase
MKEAWDDI